MTSTVREWWTAADLAAARLSGLPTTIRGVGMTADRQGWLEVAPDLAVEVVSPNDSSSDVTDKVGAYLNAGVRLVWVVYPRKRQVHVHQPGGDVRIVFGDGALDGEQVLPGFRLPLAELWG